jgi:hypothetical protein
LPNTGKYTRMFAHLPAYVPAAEPLFEIGRPGGIMDENPPRPTFVTEAPDVPDEDRSDIPAGFTYFGQFLDHNVTFQASPNFDLGQSPQNTANSRPGRIGLEQVYGFGPDLQGFLFYDRRMDHVGKFWIDEATPHDVPRNKQGVPLIADPRNDSNVIIPQLHLLFLRFHNAIVDLLPRSVPGDRRFGVAQQLAAWHFQWLVLKEHLRHIVCPSVYRRVVLEDNPLYYKPRLDQAEVPVEFATAGYRLHSLVTEFYQLNGRGGGGRLFHMRKHPFTPIPDGSGGDADLSIDWRYFFDFEAHTTTPKAEKRVQYAKKFNGKVVHTFLNIPNPIDNPLEWPKNVPDNAALNSIAVRNLLRGRALGLPSGQAVARRIGANVYSQEELGLGDEFLVQHGFALSDLPEAPLWYYVMKEADLETGGRTLGTVGSTIVAEVIHGMIKSDPSSYLYQQPNWKPTFAHDGNFTMVDLINMAQRT